MLIEFSVTNFRSIQERQTLSLVAGTGAEMRETHVAKSDAKGTPDVLRSAVIYGANAAGKSNLIAALKFMRDFVLRSANRMQGGDPIEATPFAFSQSQSDPSSAFEIVFVQDAVRYQYGFEATRMRVEREWLHAFPLGRAQTWFERDTAENSWSFGSKLLGNKQVWADATRPNALFLSTSVQLNSTQLKPIFDWFHERLRMIAPYARVDPTFSSHLCAKTESKKLQLIKFLARADIALTDIEVDIGPFDASDVPEWVPGRKTIIKAMTGEEVVHEVRFSRRLADGTSAKLDLDDESGGTQKLFALAGPWLDTLEEGLILLVDELDTSLHPLLMRLLVKCFHDPDLNQHNAQLVFSTHDTSILDQNLFRRDQVWFVEKDQDLASHLYPLSDFSPRKSENLERGYLEGRYGALPFIGELGI